MKWNGEANINPCGGCLDVWMKKKQRNHIMEERIKGRERGRKNEVQDAEAICSV